MSRLEFYKKIARIAKDSFKPVKMKELADELDVKNDRGVYNRVRGAYNHYKNIGDDHTAGQIRKTFTDEDGEYPYM